MQTTKVLTRLSLLPLSLVSTYVIRFRNVQFYPHAFLKKRRGYCNRLRLSVPLSVGLSVMLSPPKPLDKIQPNLVCELLTGMGRATVSPPAPWGPREESKGQISFNFNSKVNFKTLCLFSQMKDTKHIRRDFNSVPWGTWVMPHGSDFGELGVPRGYFF